MSNQNQVQQQQQHRQDTENLIAESDLAADSSMQDNSHH